MRSRHGAHCDIDRVGHKRENSNIQFSAPKRMVRSREDNISKISLSAGDHSCLAGWSKFRTCARETKLISRTVLVNRLNHSATDTGEHAVVEPPPAPNLNDSTTGQDHLGLRLTTSAFVFAVALPVGQDGAPRRPPPVCPPAPRPAGRAARTPHHWAASSTAAPFGRKFPPPPALGSSVGARGAPPAATRMKGALAGVWAHTNPSVFLPPPQTCRKESDDDRGGPHTPGPAACP